MSKARLQQLSRLNAVVFTKPANTVKAQRGRRMAGAWLVSLLLAGCQSLVPLPDPESEPPGQPAEKPIPRPPPARVLLLLGDQQPALQAVFDEIVNQLQPTAFDAISLAGAKTLPEETRIKLGQGDYRAAVAVGHPAAAALTGITLERRVFCQVFDYREPAADGMAGVALLPEPRQSLQAWQRISPQLRVVGMLTGSGMEPLAAEVAAAANSLGLELIHREVGSDQAFYQGFRALARRIDGLLLIPDHRVLSPGIIRRVFGYASRRSVQVLAFTPSFMELGAVAVSVNDPREVAARVLSLLGDPELYRDTRGKVLPLTVTRIETRRGFSLSESLSGSGQHAPVD